MKEIKTTLAIVIKLQSLIHSLDDLQDNVIYKHKLKQETNRYLKTIESFVNKIGASLDESESKYYTKLVKEIDDVCEKIEIEQEIK